MNNSSGGIYSHKNINNIKPGLLKIKKKRKKKYNIKIK